MNNTRDSIADKLLERELELRVQAHERAANGRPLAEVQESRRKARWYKKLARDIRSGKL
jgi:hypothetical protein